jgi:serine-type D-Ala-D-Ala carboxypeptidase/endopeptidase (penicillin-binding protein 4)
MKKIKIVGGWQLAVGNGASLCNASKLKIKLFLSSLLIFIAIGASSQQKQIGKLASAILLKDSAISTGHIGISIYEPATDKYWYNYNASHYFIPASNTKLFSLYAGMRYLGDSLVGLRYDATNTINGIIPAGDPTFLHPDFKNQPVVDFLKKNIKYIGWSKKFINSIWQTEALGYGWAWDDYNDDYFVERSPMPIYGNVVSFNLPEDSFRLNPYKGTSNIVTKPDIFQNRVYQNGYISPLKKFTLKRSRFENKFFAEEGNKNFTSQTIPFVTDGINTTRYLLNDLLYNFEYKENIKQDSINIELSKKEHRDYISTLKPKGNSDTIRKVQLVDGAYNFNDKVDIKRYTTIHSQPSDSLFKPMMHNSDNFFAEQTLLMASNEHLGFMSDEKIIDTILKSTLKDIPQKPKWVDGSGLSRYNLFTPQSFVYLLNKMKNEFGLERLKNILPTGGKGTLSAYYKKDAGFIFAKTGTLSNNCALSGYLITNKGKVLIFSVLVNNYITGATPVRKAIEQFLQSIREKY